MARRRRYGAATPEDETRTGKEKTRGSAGHRNRLRLMRYDELPEFLKDNEFILDYYRSEWPIWEALLSAFSWHNETLNIWTHLGGFLVFLALTVASLLESLETGAVELWIPGFSFSRLTNGTGERNISGNIFPDSIGVLASKAAAASMEDQEYKVSRWPRLVFMVGSICCLGCSAVSHLFACHSHRLNLFFWRLDYAGISFMIVSSFFPPIYYAFLCHPIYRLTYLSTISVLGLLAVFTLLAPALSSPRFRPFRASLFLAMGFSAVVPAIHALVVNWKHRECVIALALELVMGLSYATGAGFYVSRVPERWKPGAFDLAGHSHQIFHVFVLIGAFVHYAAISVLLDWRDDYACEL